MLKSILNAKKHIHIAKNLYEGYDLYILCGYFDLDLRKYDILYCFLKMCQENNLKKNM